MGHSWACRNWSPTTSSGSSTRTPPNTGCPMTGRRTSAASRSRSRRVGWSPAWSGAAVRPSWCSCTAGRRTPTPGTPWPGPRPPAAGRGPAGARPLRRRARGLHLGRQQRPRPGDGRRRARPECPRRRRHVARRHVVHRPGRAGPRAGARPRARRHHAGRERREGGAGDQLRQRARQLRQLRRAAGPDHRAQPGPLGVLAAARHPAQRRAARGRQLGLALRALPHRARLGRRPSSATGGRPSRGSPSRSCSCAAWPGPWSTTRTWPSSCAASPRPRVIGVEGAGHSIQGDRPLELAGILADFLFPDG